MFRAVMKVQGKKKCFGTVSAHQPSELTLEHALCSRKRHFLKEGIVEEPLSLPPETSSEQPVTH